MNKLGLATLLAGSAALAACATYPEPIPVANTSVCGNYGYVDINNDGSISGSEGNTWRSGAYGYWDLDKDGRVSRAEFENCWRAGGFYQQAYYSPDYWPNYWTAFRRQCRRLSERRRILVGIGLGADRRQCQWGHRRQRMELVGHVSPLAGAPRARARGVALAPAFG